MPLPASRSPAADRRLPDAVLCAAVYRTPWRLVRGGLVAVSRAAAPLLLLLALLASDPPISELMLLQLAVVFVLLPALAAVAIRRRSAASVEVRADELIARRAALELAVPLENVVGVAPWRLPLPGPGLTLSMRAGGRLPYCLELDDPTALLAAFDGSAASAAAGAARQHAVVRYAQARAARPPWRWYHYSAKFGLFALLPAGVFFNAHQHIAYGGPLGEYHLLGLAAYLRTLGLYWSTLALVLVLFAGGWRVLAEAGALVATYAAPARAERVRRIAEITCGVVYYAGVPLLVALRFLI